MTKARDLASNAEGTKPKVIDAAGDLIYGTGSDAASRLAIGTAGQLLTVNAGATAPEWQDAAGGGKILQVVAATDTSLVTNSTGTYADTGLTATITPSAATSKIIVLVSPGQLYMFNKINTTYADFRILRDATEIAKTNSQIGFLSPVTGGAYSLTVNGCSLLDTPNTTSATTYKMQFNNAGGSGTVDSYSFKSIILMEVGA